MRHGHLLNVPGDVTAKTVVLHGIMGTPCLSVVSSVKGALIVGFALSVLVRVFNSKTFFHELYLQFALFGTAQSPVPLPPCTDVAQKQPQTARKQMGMAVFQY